jgi:hypothetical protein
MQRFSVSISPELRPLGASGAKDLSERWHGRSLHDSRRLLPHSKAHPGLRAKMPHGFLRSFLAEGKRVWFEPALGLSGIPVPALFDILAT